ncbi:hypothetical protein GCM10027447_12260 [Glycomyces halotolerans]
MTNFDDYLILNWPELEKLDPAERFRVLGDLAEGAGAWITDQRGQYLEQLRAELGLDDEALAERLGVGKVALARLGDGPMTAQGVRPALLRRGAELLLEHTDRHTGDLMKALGMLTKRGRPVYADQRAAARRIAVAAGDLADGHLESMSRGERALVARAVAHASEVAEGRQWRPDQGEEEE